MEQFRNDYCVIAHPKVLQKIVENQFNQFSGYGLDEHCANAEKLILKAFNIKNGSVFFVSGGTQANLTVISYLLKPYEAVICCDTGHINVHETGAVEATGHKAVTVKNIDGKLNIEEVKKILQVHSDEHMVKPKMIYISDSTETGTIYSKQELQQIRDICDEYGLYLFVDGARLGIALTNKTNDVTPEFLGSIADIFYVGGTKNGCMYGEAIVFKNKDLSKDFRYHIKNRGAMSAKGYILGMQFEALFENNLFFEIAESANSLADYIKNELSKNGIKLYGNSPSNQVFVYLNNTKAEEIINKFGCEMWIKGEKESVIRIVTSFINTLEGSKELINEILK